uniref:Uncharacterized protein n=1 Tax=Macaca fascicularis TaxID=9541 RepID=A0A7N9CHZ0_MACFA
PACYWSVQVEWLPELKEDCMPHCPYRVTGSEFDLKEDNKTLGRILSMEERSLSTESLLKLRKKMGSVCFVTCSAIPETSCKSVFEEAIAKIFQEKKKRKKRCSVGQSLCLIL